MGLMDLGLCQRRGAEEQKKPLDSGHPVQLPSSCSLSGMALLLPRWASSFSMLAWLGMSAPLYFSTRGTSRDKGGLSSQAGLGSSAGASCWWSQQRPELSVHLLVCRIDTVPPASSDSVEGEWICGYKALTQCLPHSQC